VEDMTKKRFAVFFGSQCSFSFVYTSLLLMFAVSFVAVGLCRLVHC